MFKKRILSISAVCILFLVYPAFGEKVLTFPDKNGKIVDQDKDYKIRLIESTGSGVKTAEAVFLVKAKPETVFKTVTDYEHYPEFMPNITKAIPVEKNSSEHKYKFTLKIAFVDINYTLLLKEDVKEKKYSLTWEYVEGDIKDTSGAWLITQYDNDKEYSHILYRVKTDPGRFIPDWVADRLSTRSIPDMIKAIRKQSVEKQ